MSKVIEVIVLGGVGSGKSHVLDLIDKALRAEFGENVTIESPELDAERAMGSPGARPDAAQTVFELKEGRPEACLGPAQPFQFVSDPISDAISNAASCAQGAEGLTLLILQEHLKKLCEMQRAEHAKH